MNASRLINPDQDLVLRLSAAPGVALPFDSNPLGRELGARLLSADATAGTVSIEFQVQERHCQGAGIVQGGIVATMLDFALALAVLARLPPGHTAATAALNVQFMRAALPGAYLARGSVERLGKSIAFARAELCRAGSEAIVAAATATMPLLAPGGPAQPPVS